MDELVEKVLRIAALVEDRDDALAFRLSRLARTISAAKQTDVKLDSWDDFASWWNQNRSQGLLFSLVDALGSDNPIIGQMKSVMAEQDQLEAKLHDIYLQLKGQQGTLPAEPATTETEPMPEPEPVAAPALDEAPADQADDLDALLDEEKGASVKKKSAAPEGWPTVDDVAQELHQIANAFDWDHLVRTTGDTDVDVRLQVREDGSWDVRSGDASYDTDHRGFWGSGSLSNDTNFKTLAADLIDQAEDDRDGADIERSETSAATHQAAKKSAQEIADMLISTIEAVGVEKDDQGYTVPSSDPEWIDLGEAYEKAKRGQIVQAIVALVSTIKETGGVEQDAKGYTVPVADPEWIDLGIVYDAAVAYMSKSKSKA